MPHVFLIKFHTIVQAWRNDVGACFSVANYNEAQSFWYESVLDMRLLRRNILE